MKAQEQIKLLQEIKAEIIRRSKLDFDSNQDDAAWMCNIYYDLAQGGDNFDWSEREEKLREDIPLFTFKNALQFGADISLVREGQGWWDGLEYTLRIHFIDWMIEQLEIEDNNTFMMGL